jgi:hypothetical protein
MDETGLFWEQMADRIYISKEEKTVPGFKGAKDELRFLLGGNADRDHRLNQYLVYHSDLHELKNINRVTLSVYCD